MKKERKSERGREGGKKDMRKRNATHSIFCVQIDGKGKS